MEQKIYLLFACDEWKSNKGLVCATTSLDKLKAAILQCIKDGDMTYFDCNGTNSIEEQCGWLENDWEGETAFFINDRLAFGFFEMVTDGELI